MNVTGCALFEGNSSKHLDSFKTDSFKAVAILRVVISFGFGTAAVFMNTLILRGLLLAKDLPRPCRTLLLNMSSCDLLTGIVMMVNCVLLFRPDYTGYYQCVSGMTMQSVVALVSITLSTIFPINAYLSQLVPFQYRSYMSPIKVVITTVIIWTVAAVMTTISLLGQFSNYCACDLMLVYSPLAFRGFGVFYFSCLAVMSTVYWKLYTLARRHICKIVSQTHAEHKSAMNVSLQIRALKTVSEVAVTFILMYAPFSVYLFVISFDFIPHPSEVHFVLQLFFMTFFMSKCVLNPLIYSWKIPFVRDVTSKLFSRWCKRSQGNIMSITLEKTTFPENRALENKDGCSA